MLNADSAGTWSIEEALAVSYDAFVARLGADLLWRAFEAMTRHPQEFLAEHRRLKKDIDKYLGWPLRLEGLELAEWMANARRRDGCPSLLTHIGARWWRAREALLVLPPGTRVPCVYSEGSQDHVSRQLLAQMLYRGAAPDTTRP
jgi:hypothetical protein